MLQAPNADVVILDGCCSCASSRVDNIYTILSTLGFILEQQKLFEIMQTLYLVHIMLIQLQDAEGVNSAWDVHMKQSLKDDNENHIQVFFSHQEI